MHNITGKKMTPAFKILSILVIMLAALVSVPIWTMAADEGEELATYQNSETGYEAIVIDEADLLTDGEEKSLLEDMAPVTDFGNAIFYSTDRDQGSASYVSSKKFNEYYGSNKVSGTLFLIDMANREIYIYGSGDASYIITDSKSYTITDNVYRYASKQEYYKCASEAFRQINIVLNDGKIAQPMKLVSNIFLAIMLGLLIAYWIVRANSSVRRASEKEMLAAIQSQQQLLDYSRVFTHQTKKYDPPSSSSSGGGGGGGGGGGHSSGGGHSF